MNTKTLNTVSKPASKQSHQTSSEWPIAVLRENEHYYMENGFMVFTEVYHRARGACCGNACRHCPYEHINVKK